MIVVLIVVLSFTGIAKQSNNTVSPANINAVDSKNSYSKDITVKSEDYKNVIMNGKEYFKINEVLTLNPQKLGMKMGNNVSAENNYGKCYV